METNADTKRNNKLRILCIHGFRQSGVQFRGRTAALQKKLKGVADFYFVNGPHTVHDTLKVEDVETERGSQTRPRFSWLVNHSNNQQCSDNIEEPLSLPHSTKSKIASLNIKYPPTQYIAQCDGWEASRNLILQIIAKEGPFDGILGFSQGASVAAAIAANFFSKAVPNGSLADTRTPFKFVILCSGFLLPASDIAMDEVRDGKKVIHCPSLHIFGDNTQHDRQIACTESEILSEAFSPDEKVVVKHPFGHIIPVQKDYINIYKLFLSQFGN